MFYNFEAEKAVQAAAVLLRAHSGNMSLLRLLKLLYIADREAIRQSGRPIIGNNPVAMKHGPLHSKVYDLVKGGPEEAIWSQFIARDINDLELIDDPGALDLSRFEIRILNDVAEQFRGMGEWEIVDHTHTFAEWIKNYQAGSSRPIPFADILDGIGISGEDKAAMLAEIEAEMEDEMRIARERRGRRPVSTT